MRQQIKTLLIDLKSGHLGYGSEASQYASATNTA